MALLLTTRASPRRTVAIFFYFFDLFSMHFRRRRRGAALLCKEKLESGMRAAEARHETTKQRSCFTKSTKQEWALAILMYFRRELAFSFITFSRSFDTTSSFFITLFRAERFVIQKVDKRLNEFGRSKDGDSYWNREGAWIGEVKEKQTIRDAKRTSESEEILGVQRSDQLELEKGDLIEN